MNHYTNLIDLIDSEETLVVPDAYDGISASIIEKSGFKAVQCSGYSLSISKSYSRESQVTLEENLRRTKTIVDAVKIPVFADGEDGYGSGDIFYRNMEKFAETGIAGINLEDQNLWAPYTGNPLLPLSESLEKIRWMKENCPEIFINARTDALNVSEDKHEGIKEAIQRCNRFREEGADLCFVTGVSTKEEMKRLNNEIDGPVSIAAGLPYNIDQFDISDCRELGIARVSLPSIMIYNAVQSQLTMLQKLQSTGSLAEISNNLVDGAKLQDLLHS